MIYSVSIVPADEKFPHPAFVLVNCINKKLYIYRTLDFEKVFTMNTHSSIHDVYIPNADYQENSTSKIIAICGQSQGKTGNIKVRKTKTGFDFDL